METGNYPHSIHQILIVDLIFLVLSCTIQLISTSPDHHFGLLKQYPSKQPEKAGLVGTDYPPKLRLDIQQEDRSLRVLSDWSTPSPSYWLQSAHRLQTDNKCENAFGLPFIQDWKTQRDQWCQKAASHPTLSQIVSYPKVMPTDFFPASEKRRERLKRNVALELFNITLTSSTYTVFETGKLGDPKPKPGSVKASCKLDQNAPTWAFKSVRGTSELIQSAMQEDQDRSVRQACTLGTNKTAIVEHPVLFLYRYDTTNSYHNMENVLAVFTTLAMLDSLLIAQHGVEVVIVDGKSLGYYLEIWKRISSYPLRILRDNPYPPDTCFRYVISPAFAAPFLLHGFWQYKHILGVTQGRHCRSSIFIAFSNWLRALFPELTALQRSFQVDLQATVNSNSIKTYGVLWISRRNYESAHIYKGKFNSWQLSRAISNDDELQLELRRTVLSWNDGACFRHARSRSRSMLKTGSGKPCRMEPVMFNFQVIELSDIPLYPDQLLKLSGARILVGVHGAGMSNMIWMLPEKSGVIEVMHNAGGNDHYAHMAKLLGHRYDPVSSSGKAVNVAGTTASLMKMMDALAT
ncbi:hypothetical protein CEUSTIGMA_g4062.t1 [Chlamydomonas eustigma]|uniref:Uncharacterized protein n=1 Tax=Chlamydomonas eustigma TaxID=1157962 RepID=A0A250X0P1_9CHLO|nr:hypothetical protein CEUSTIGMA_g4062.t1 [Chlamydomonas eustigma]|eukprot:GAX76616.1 hypothetical protein CEUSTIGMA_g4062.t1 [Chlamydomonas eustigma]